MIRKNFKQLILAVAKPLLWNSYKSVYKALEIVLSPCCDVDISDVDYTCVSTSGTNAILDVVITLDKNVSLLGNGVYVATWVISGRSYSFTGDFTNGSSITLNDITLPDNSSGTVAVTLLLPVNTASDNGAFMSTAAYSTTLPNC